MTDQPLLPPTLTNSWLALIQYAIPKLTVLQILPQYTTTIDNPPTVVTPSPRWRLGRATWVIDYRSSYNLNLLAQPQPDTGQWEPSQGWADLAAIEARDRYRRTRRGKQGEGPYPPDPTLENLLSVNHHVNALTMQALAHLRVPVHIVGPGCPDLSAMPRDVADVAMASEVVSIRPTYFDHIDYTPFLSSLPNLRYIHLETVRVRVGAQANGTQFHYPIYRRATEISIPLAQDRLLSLVRPLMELPFQPRNHEIDHPFDPTRRLGAQGSITLVRQIIIHTVDDPQDHHLSLLVGRTLNPLHADTTNDIGSHGLYIIIHDHRSHVRDADLEDLYLPLEYMMPQLQQFEDAVANGTHTRRNAHQIFATQELTPQLVQQSTIDWNVYYQRNQAVLRDMVLQSDVSKFTNIYRSLRRFC